jgi:transporter family-2 protein
VAKAWLAAMALASGSALALQVGFNGRLRERLGHPILAATASFAIGLALLLAYLAALRPGPPPIREAARGPGWIWLGGLVGAVYVATSAAYAARLGAAAWLGLVVTGQVLTSLVLDHYGLLGFPAHPVTPARLLGALLLLAGLAIVLRT